MTANETASEHDAGPEGAKGGDVPVLALVVAWCPDAWRLGHSLTIPPGNPGPTVIFGRGDEPSGGARRVLLEQRRPGQPIVATPPLDNPVISRTQLELRSLGAHRLHVRNVGRCKLLHDGRESSEAEVGLGETLQLGKQLLFVLADHAAGAPAGVAYPAFPFGEADTQGMVGESSAVWSLRHQVAALAQRAGHVLVLGGSGSGKELVAQAIHALSNRRARPLIARSAATLPDALVDAELFGNQKNYPNAGMPERAGMVGQADGSSLFLDELAELPQAAQAHLLRVLDQGEYHRLGEASARRSDFRLIAATNRDPATLKADLFARLILRVAVPDLDARRDDVPLLIRHIIRRAAQAGDELARRLVADRQRHPEPEIAIDVMRGLLARRYPLNVRELESTLWQALSGAAPQRTPAGGATPVAGLSAASEADRIQRALDENNGAIELTWRALKLRNRFALLRLIKKHGLEVRRRPGNAPARRA
jgi:transcriptional regulator with AAA-type ATPase domain